MPDFEVWSTLLEEVAAMGPVDAKDLLELNVQVALLLLERDGFTPIVQDLPRGPAFVRGSA